MNTSKTIIEPKKKKTLNTRDNLFHKYDSYCCPLCSSLPEILHYNDINRSLKIKCKKHGINDYDIEDYMEKMVNWESISEIKLKNKCSFHNEQYAYYCQDCEQNMCKKCLELFPIHKEHVKYEISSLRLNNSEMSLIKETINVFLQKKDELIRKIKNLDDKITFYDTLINSYERQNPNFLLNINLKHLLYGEKLNFDAIKNTDFVNKQSKKEIFDDFIKKNFLKATKGLNQITLIDKNIGNDLLQEIINGIGNSTVYRTLKFGGKIKDPKEVIKLENIKLLNLRGNKLSSLNFISGKVFPFLEIISLNDNEFDSIDTLKNISFPLLKELYLSKNKISNIDILSELNIPKLRILWLSNNNITSIDVLEKVKFPQLAKLGLNKNKINNISVFAKNKAKFPQLFELYLNDNEFDLKAFYNIIKELQNKVQEFYF